MNQRGKIRQNSQREGRDEQHHHHQPAPEKRAAFRFDMHRAIAEGGVVELVARKRDMHPRQGETQRHDRQQAIADEELEILPSRAGLPGIAPAPGCARQAIAARAEQRDLQEDEQREEIEPLERAD